MRITSRIFIKLIVFSMSLATMSACVSAPLMPSTAEPQTSFSSLADAAAAQSAAVQFLDAWQIDDYPTMYSLLSSLSQDAFDLQAFEEIYQDYENTLTLERINYKALSAMAARR